MVYNGITLPASPSHAPSLMDNQSDTCTRDSDTPVQAAAVCSPLKPLHIQVLHKQENLFPSILMSLIQMFHFYTLMRALWSLDVNIPIQKGN